MSKNAYQVLGLLKTACLEEIEMAYALKTYHVKDISQCTEAVNILRNESNRAYLNMELPYYLPVGWSMAHINHLPEYRDFVLGNINGDLQSIESEEPYLNMLSGTALYLQGEFNKALDYYLKTEIQLLDDKHLYFNIALTYVQLGNAEKASAYIKSVLPSLSYIELALALKKFPLNREEILQLLKESSKQSASAYWEVLEILLSLHELSIAENIWEKAVLEQPNNLDLQFYILQICLEKTDFTAATSYYHQLNRQFPNSKPSREAARLLCKIGELWFSNLWDMQEYVTAIKLLGQVSSINLKYEELLAESVSAFLATNPKEADKLKIEPEILKTNSYYAFKQRKL